MNIKLTNGTKTIIRAKDQYEANINHYKMRGFTPVDAVSYCSSVLSEHYNIINSISNPSILEIDKPVSEEILQIRKLLESSIDEMELSVRSHNCLEAAGITLIGELVDKDEAEMLEYKNFGRKSLNELIEKLETMGLKFGMDTSPYTEDEA